MKDTSFEIDITGTPLADAAKNALGAAQSAHEFGKPGVVLCQLYRYGDEVFIKGGFITNAHGSRLQAIVNEYAESLREEQA